MAELTPEQKTANLASFELVWSTVRDRHPDPKLNGLNWQAVHDATKPLIAKADSMDTVRTLLRAMLRKLNSSHYAIIPGDLYQPVADTAGADPSTNSDSSAGITPVLLDGKAVVESVAPGSPAERAGIRPGMTLQGIDGAEITPMLRLADNLKDQEGRRIVARSVARKLDAGTRGEVLRLDVLDENGAPKHISLERAEPPGKLVTFGNLPQSRLIFESRRLPGGAGYIHFNEFLDPVSLMPQFEAAVKEFATGPGIILDLRGNPGGIGVMAMGIAGFFIDKRGLKLGEMKMRETTLKFVVFPRAETYEGKLAILLDAGSASTTEILAQGLQDLKRARIFGSRSAGAALPSDIIRLPNGDGFQFAQASYTSVNGKVLEGAGVTPDVKIEQTQQALLAGHDLVVEAAEAWISP
ncbi:MAG: S41 family peptidase [Acidobacteriota bacterium]|nr:S41 family peptidase [Acidobacteriota bacterium]